MYSVDSPVRVFILAGQSNMEGKGGIDPLLNHQIQAAETRDFFAHLHRYNKNITIFNRTNFLIW